MGIGDEDLRAGTPQQLDELRVLHQQLVAVWFAPLRIFQRNRRPCVGVRTSTLRRGETMSGVPQPWTVGRSMSAVHLVMSGRYLRCQADPHLSATAISQ